MKRNVLVPVILVVMAFLTAATPARCQTDPFALQQSAVQRIDGYVEHFRKTGDTQTLLPELQRAAAELDASNRILETQQKWSQLARGLLKLGHVYRIDKQWPKAVALYQQSEEAAKRASDLVQQADASAWRALAESSRSNLGQAFADAAQAVRLAERTADKDVLARSLDVLGIVQVSQGNLVGAADTHSRELAAAAEAKDPVAPYYAYLNRSDVYLKLGQLCDFQRSFASCYQALDRARADLEQALELARRLDFPGLVRQTESFIGSVETRRKMVQSQEAMHEMLKRVGIFHPKKPGDVIVNAKFVPRPVPVPPELGELVRAEERAAKQLGGFADTVQARLHFTKGMMNELQGDNDAALVWFLKAVAALEADRRTLREERSRGAFLADRIGFYYAAILQLLDHGRQPEAFELLERARSRALADLLASRKLGLDRPMEQQLYVESAVLRTRIADAQGKLLELASDPEAAKRASQINVVQRQISSLEAEEQKIVARMAVEAPRLQSLVTSVPVDLKTVQQSMRAEGYEILQYLVVEWGVIVWHIAPDSMTIRNVFLPRSEVMAKVASLQETLADRNRDFDAMVAREMFLYLIQPVLSGIRAEHLVIIPHEDLNYVPFEVFQDPADGRYLGERFKITYAPSASVLLDSKASGSLAGGRLLAIADPDIEAANPEVRTIVKLFGGQSKVVTDTLAGESDVKAWSRDFDVIHLAVHGKFNAAEPMLSHLSLAAGGGEDGRLTAAEMFGLPLDKARLVVLSACETGRAEATHGNEILGMQRALMYAGAGTLVLSRWKVDSAATSLWMQSFYQAAASTNLPEAARTALMKVKSKPEYKHPYYWAAFTMTGR